MLKVGRNQPCPCGSGTKFKRCCGQSTESGAAGSRNLWEDEGPEFPLPVWEPSQGINPFIHRNFSQIFQTVRWSLDQKLTIPALILIYTAIDIAAGLNGGSGNPQQKFEHWVNEYLSPETSFRCSASDLFGARCGLVHGFSPVSGLSKKGKARKIVYAHGTSKAETLAKLTRTVRMTEVVLHVEGLFECTRQGIGHFLEEAENNPGKNALLAAKAGEVFGEMTEEDVSKLQVWTRQKLGP